MQVQAWYSVSLCIWDDVNVLMLHKFYKSNAFKYQITVD